MKCGLFGEYKKHSSKKRNEDVAFTEIKRSVVDTIWEKAFEICRTSLKANRPRKPLAPEHDVKTLPEKSEEEDSG